MSAKVTGFRFALWVILIGSVVLSAISGAVWGAFSAGLTGGSVVGHALGGALLSGAVGWVLGCYAHGIGYTLLSINDHLEVISDTLRGKAPFNLSATTPGRSQTSEPRLSGSAPPAARRNTSRRALSDDEAAELWLRWKTMTYQELCDELERFGFDVQRSRTGVLVTYPGGGRREAAATRDDVLKILEREITRAD